MANSLKERKYKCKCGEEVKEYVWDNDLDKYEFPCTQCSQKVNFSNLVKEKKVEVQGIRTPTKNR
jgi:predicted SprT family Zn-dependent metalloprotease